MNERHAPATAEASRPHDRVVNVDGILLKSGPAFAPRSCRRIGFTWRVSLRFFPGIAPPFGPTPFLVCGDRPTRKCPTNLRSQLLTPEPLRRTSSPIGTGPAKVQREMRGFSSPTTTTSTPPNGPRRSSVSSPHRIGRKDRRLHLDSLHLRQATDLPSDGSCYILVMTSIGRRQITNDFLPILMSVME